MQVQNDKIMGFDKRMPFTPKSGNTFSFRWQQRAKTKNERRYECEYDLSDSCEMKSEANPLCKMVVIIISVKYH